MVRLIRRLPDEIQKWMEAERTTPGGQYRATHGRGVDPLNLRPSALGAGCLASEQPKNTRAIKQTRVQQCRARGCCGHPTNFASLQRFATYGGGVILRADGPRSRL